ncbi:transcriptional regulator with PAS, ATPase and Fis domain [Dongia mobilis]|uniref:HTH-type transcriptional regulatory protein TyrR n=1 Tax=Dongia mobilis TaxID=578943 RepID=A0A4V3DF61_9PROT|nr:sigma 54-interacting transcriptional regulator [Dongia mobilis]TDQ84111.1 transcriptional regulator with PAS, ATPase and Fis domain [Dongia mobilis]
MSRTPLHGASDVAVFDALADGIILLDAELNLRFLNASAAEMLGVVREAALGLSFVQLTARSTADLAELLELVEGGRKAEAIVRAGDGRVLMTSLRQVEAIGKATAGMLLQMRDIAVLDHERDRAGAKESRRAFRFLSQQKLRPDLSHQRRLSSQLDRLLTLGERSMAQNARVLLTGESGVGKTEIARHLHVSASGANAPFIHVNCGSIPDSLFESEMFGYERGSFTGALQTGRKGLIESADGGTLFLDEVGEIPLPMQAKLLKFLESSTIQRIGGSAEHAVKVRVISATNRDLETMVKKGEFRRDLFYRLAVVPLTVRPLRQTPELFDDLVDYLVAVVNQRRLAPMTLTRECRDRLRGYHFPGNIRELHNIIQQLSVLADKVAEVKHLPETVMAAGMAVNAGPIATDAPRADLKEIVRAYERQVIARAIAQHGSKRKAAEALGVDIGTIVRKTQMEQ